MIRSPLVYQESKYTILPNLFNLMPQSCNTFYDLFGGSATVVVNYLNCKNKHYNEFNKITFDFIDLFKNGDLEKLDNHCKETIEHFGLNNNIKDCFYMYRDYLNSFDKINIFDLFIIMKYCYGNVIRFNKNGKINSAYGDGRYNDRTIKSLCNFKQKLKDVTITNENFFSFDFSIINKGDFVYLDPPYFNTKGDYNKNWTINDDYKLFKIIEDLNNRGIKFGMSNVFFHNKEVNDHLIKWCEDNNFYVYHLKKKYNPFNARSISVKMDEVYITNFKRKELV